MTMAPKREGYFYGVLDVYYALMTTEETVAAAPVYGAPKILAKTIEVTVTPVYKEGKVYASNVATRNEKRIDGYTVSLNMDKIPAANLSELLGRVTDSKGVQVITGSQIAPNVAIGFAVTADDGSEELWWIYKGKFAEITRTAKTETNTIEYHHPTIEGNFVRRANDNALAAVVDTSVTGVQSTVTKGWFTAVYEPEISAAE